VPGKTASSPAHQIIVITEYYYAAVSAVQTPWPIKCGYVPNMVNLNFQRPLTPPAPRQAETSGRAAEAGERRMRRRDDGGLAESPRKSD